MEKSKINKIIKEEIELFFEDLTFFYGKTYYPTQDVINNCKKALDIVSKNNLITHGGNEGSGIRKAKSIIEKKPMSHSVVKRMKSFFDNNYLKVSSLKSQGKTIHDSEEIQKWELWGGDPGRNWANKNISDLNKSNLRSKSVKRSSGIQKTSTLMNPYNTRIRK